MCYWSVWEPLGLQHEGPHLYLLEYDKNVADQWHHLQNSEQLRHKLKIITQVTYQSRQDSGARIQMGGVG